MGVRKTLITGTDTSRLRVGHPVCLSPITKAPQGAHPMFPLSRDPMRFHGHQHGLPAVQTDSLPSEPSHPGDSTARNKALSVKIQLNPGLMTAWLWEACRGDIGARAGTRTAHTSWGLREAARAAASTEDPLRPTLFCERREVHCRPVPRRGLGTSGSRWSLRAQLCTCSSRSWRRTKPGGSTGARRRPGRGMISRPEQ